MSGHVFVTMSDLTKVACDAWILPTDGLGHVTRAWRTDVPDGVRFDDGWYLQDLPDPWPPAAVAKVEPWCRQRRAGERVERHNQAWAANIGSDIPRAGGVKRRGRVGAPRRWPRRRGFGS